jgi:serine/threonine protein kinase
MRDTEAHSETVFGKGQLPGEPFESRYEVLEELGRGGMGIVYRARHRHLDKVVAVKIVQSRIDSVRFLREARLLAKVTSPHVVGVHDFDILPNGSPILVMELLDGRDLRQVIEKEKQPLDELATLEWMRQVATGLSAAAQHGIIHRDVKPSNIHIDNQGCARVMDFGLSRMHGDGVDLTESSSWLGTSPGQTLFGSALCFRFD